MPEVVQSFVENKDFNAVHNMCGKMLLRLYVCFINQNFFGSLFAGIDEEKLRQFCDVFEQLRTNLDNNRKEGKY